MKKTTITYLLKKTWNTLSENIWIFLPIIFLFYFVPTTIYSIYNIYNPLEEELLINPITNTINTDYLINYFTTHSIIGILITLLTIYGGLVITYFVIKQKEIKSLNEVMKKTLRIYPKILLLFLLITLITIPLYLLLIIPGIIFSIYVIFSQHIIIDKNKNIIQSMKQSYKIIKSKWWKTFGKLLFLVLITMIAVMTLTMINTSIFFAIQGTSILTEGLTKTNLIISEIITAAGITLTALFSIIFTAHLYQGMRDEHNKKNKKIKK